MSAAVPREPRPNVYAAVTAALSSLAMPVVVIGAGHGPVRSCATGTAMYVSFVPPQVAVALHPGSTTCALVLASGEFSVSFLSTGQLDVAIRAGRSGPAGDKFNANDIPVAEPPDAFAAPAVGGSISAIWCRVAAEIPTGDHVLIVGTVGAHRPIEPGTPLLRTERRYIAGGEALTDPAPEGYPL